jgi:dCTP deaminase
MRADCLEYKMKDNNQFIGRNLFCQRMGKRKRQEGSLEGRLSLLSDTAILRHMKAGNIIIHPFNDKNLGTVSYDVTLGPHYYRERDSAGSSSLLNPYDERMVRKIWKQEEARTACKESGERDLGFGANIRPEDRVIILAPGETILAHTLEFIGGRNKVTTMMKARSSWGRNFIEVCKCAGWGDVGYTNRWTMEVTNNSRHYHIPLVVGRRIAQIAFFEVEKPREREGYVKAGKYQSSVDVQELERAWSPEAMLPKMWKDWEVSRTADQ